MLTEGSDLSDGSDLENLGRRRNGTVQQRNSAATPERSGAGAGRTGSAPHSNGGMRGGSNSVFNRTLRDLDPVLRQDKIFQDEMRKLDQLYEAKLASLQAAHEESRRKIAISAMVRNRKGLDVNRLMESAAARRDVEIKSKNVYKQAADSECFKVMLDSMSPGARRGEFDDGKAVDASGGGGGQSIIRELEDDDDLDYERMHDMKSQDIYSRRSTSKSGSDYSIQNSDVGGPPIAVSPISRNGKHHETQF